ncbi:MAG: CoA-binding protein, partial [Bacteroidales bacterium]|nr:CoA-binding protein [Bacteroidales bacterium]
MPMLENLFVPQSVAVVGASRTPGKVGHEILSNLIRGGYAGTIVPVNPYTQEILNHNCFPDLPTYGKAVDLTIIALPAEKALPAVEAALANGTKTLIVLAAGFGEAGIAGIKRQEQLTTLCQENSVRLLGPNCLGIINTAHHLNASFSKQMPKKGLISVVSQSGAVCTALLDWAASRDLGIAKVVSIGNRVDINITDILEALTDDEQTEVVVGYVEGISEGERFIETARKLSQRKPLILLRSGVTQPGIWAASAHTGHLVGA